MHTWHNVSSFTCLGISPDQGQTVTRTDDLQPFSLYQSVGCVSEQRCQLSNYFSKCIEVAAHSMCDKDNNNNNNDNN